MDEDRGIAAAIADVVRAEQSYRSALDAEQAALVATSDAWAELLRAKAAAKALFETLGVEDAKDLVSCASRRARTDLTVPKSYPYTV